MHPRYKYFEQINLKSEIGLKMYLIMLVTNSLSNRQFTSSENRSKHHKSFSNIELIKRNSGFSAKFNFSSALNRIQKNCLGYNICLITQFLVRQLKLSKLVELLYLAFEIQDCILELGKGS